MRTSSLWNNHIWFHCGMCWRDTIISTANGQMTGGLAQLPGRSSLRISKWLLKFCRAWLKLTSKTGTPTQKSSCFLAYYRTLFPCNRTWIANQTISTCSQNYPNHSCTWIGTAARRRKTKTPISSSLKDELDSCVIIYCLFFHIPLFTCLLWPIIKHIHIYHLVQLIIQLIII